MELGLGEMKVGDNKRIYTKSAPAVCHQLIVEQHNNVNVLITLMSVMHAIVVADYDV